jgi:competence protein ComEC
MRAAFMGWLMLLAREIGRPSSSSRLLLVAATILLAINPWQLLFDAGFALSFLAMWGLLAWSPLFGHWLAFLPDKLELRQTMSMTLAATLMTAPYLAWSFGRLTLIGILTNAVALPIVPFVMGSGAIAAIWGTWPGSAIVSAPALGLARMIQAIADSSSFLPWLNFEITGMKFSTCIATYVLLVYLRSLFSGKNDLSTEKRAS